MRTEDVIERFKATGALLEGHFVLSSGLHSANYLQCALLLQHPAEAEKFAQALAQHFADFKIELVVSPAIGGLIIGHEVARQLDARFIWTERETGEMTLRRGFTVASGETTLVVEDVITTGGSTLETVRTVQALGANVVAAASIIDRSSGKADVGVPRFALASLDVPSVDPSLCEQCKSGEPAIKPGSRKT
ncbi:MAG: orotate phosphoribosyltransferase [Pyrinomonadaceae bacterium]